MIGGACGGLEGLSNVDRGPSRESHVCQSLGQNSTGNMAQGPLYERNANSRYLGGRRLWGHRPRMGAVAIVRVPARAGDIRDCHTRTGRRHQGNQQGFVWRGGGWEVGPVSHTLGKPLAGVQPGVRKRRTCSQECNRVRGTRARASCSLQQRGRGTRSGQPSLGLCWPSPGRAQCTEGTPRGRVAVALVGEENME